MAIGHRRRAGRKSATIIPAHRASTRALPESVQTTWEEAPEAFRRGFQPSRFRVPVSGQGFWVPSLLVLGVLGFFAYFNVGFLGFSGFLGFGGFGFRV